MLEKQIYIADSQRKTIYCNARFDAHKKISPAPGFVTKKYKKRAKKVEWEHVVPAENFGRNFSEWRKGDSLCVTRKGKRFKGRRCAEKVNQHYRLMQADMYNLYPAIGAVNAARSNYNFVMQEKLENSFGNCAMKIADKKVQPPQSARGRIARAYIYMQENYDSYKMSRQQEQLMHAWNRQYPVTRWECQRGERIADLQGNDNQLLMQSCAAAGY